MAKCETKTSNLFNHSFLLFQRLATEQFVGSATGNNTVYGIVGDKYRRGDGTGDNRVRVERTTSAAAAATRRGAVLANHISIPGDKAVGDSGNELLDADIYVD